MKKFTDSGKKLKVSQKRGLKVQFALSYTMAKWVYFQKQLKLQLPALSKSKVNLNEILSGILPPLERDLALAGYSNEELLKALAVKKDDEIPFILSLFERMGGDPYYKDQLFEKLQLNFTLSSKNTKFSIALNQLSGIKPFCNSSMRKSFDVGKLLNNPLPQSQNLSLGKRKELIRVMRYALLLLERETDPLTYMDERSIQYFQLDRGLSIAIFGMEEERQLSLESYVGYTLFKNGYPAAYGGAWIFGALSLFGINIFESARGGESGYMMCQILRIYKQVFGISHFKVEPYQYGEGNPEGIETGAFWFYYRHGFRPVDKGLARLAKSEWGKIQKDRSYRSTRRTLLAFTKSNMILSESANPLLYPYQVRSGISEYIGKYFRSDRAAAERNAMQDFLKAGYKGLITRSAIETSLLFKAFELNTPSQIKSLIKMASLKGTDVRGYNSQLKKILEILT